MSSSGAALSKAQGDAAYASVGKTLVRRIPRLDQTINVPTMGSPPAFTLSGPGGSGPIAGSTTVPRTSALFTQLGCVPSDTGNFIRNLCNSNATQTPWAVEFDTYSDKFDLRLGCRASGDAVVWVWVDGRPATAAPVIYTGVTGATQTLWHLLVDFGSADLRRVRIYLYQVDFGGVQINPAHSISPTPKTAPSIATYGDSFLEAGGLSGSDKYLAGMDAKLARLLDWEIYRCGQAGTGYVADGGGGTKGPYTDSGRLTQLGLTGANYVLVFGSSNDDVSSAAAVGAAATSLYASIATQLPNAKVIVVGPQSLAGTVAAARTANDTAIRTAALAAGNVLGYISPCTGDAGASWVTGSGSSTGPVGDGNADTFNNGAVSGHPTQAGHDYYARRMFQAVTALLGA